MTYEFSMDNLPATRPCSDDLLHLLDLFKDMPRPVVTAPEPHSVVEVVNSLEYILDNVQNQYQAYAAVQLVKAFDALGEQVYMIQNAIQMGLEAGVGFIITDETGKIVGGDDLADKDFKNATLINEDGITKDMIAKANGLDDDEDLDIFSQFIDSLDIPD